MNPNDTYITAELFTEADFQIYLKHGWTLLDIKAGDNAYPVVFLVGKEKPKHKETTNNEK